MNEEQITTTLTLTCLFTVIGLLVMDIGWKHAAVVHHAAFYETSSWGFPSFHWNDVSFAQTPFQK